MSKRVAIVQSNYIPWKGYFDLIGWCDEFILFDDVQYTKRDWRNRNLIKTQNGLLWLTMPVEVKGKFTQRICDSVISLENKNWASKHLSSIEQNYAKAKYFQQYHSWLRDLYARAESERFLSKINHAFLIAICEILEIKTKITWSMDYGVIDGKNERLMDLCRKSGANEYLSGPAAKEYMDTTLFSDQGIKVIFADYSNYPEYTQLHPPFQHGVTVMDLIFNEGPKAREFMKFPAGLN